MKKLCLILSIGIVTLTSGAIAAEPVRLGFVYMFSGRGAILGGVSKQGAELAIEEINKAGGINGRQVVGIFRDSKAKPDVGGEAARKLVTEDKVDAVIGVISSGVVPKVSEVLNELRTPLIITTAVNPIVTGKKCNRYTFRVVGTANMLLKATALIAKKTGAKRWTTIGPDYALGHGSWALFKKYLKEASPDVEFLPESDAVFAPLATTDWSRHIRAVMNTTADGVLISLWGGNFTDFSRQAQDLGFFDGSRSAIMPTVAVSEVLSLGASCPVGFWVSSSYWPAANPGGYDRAFTKNYTTKFGSPPGYPSQFAYSGVMAYAKAAGIAASTDKEAVVNALEGLTIDLPVGTLTIRPEDHQAIFDFVGGRISKKTAITPRKRLYRLLDSVTVIKGSEVALPIDQTGCNMK